MYNLDSLQKKKVADLKDIASELNLKKFEKLNKTNLIYKILDEQATSSSSQHTPSEEKGGNKVSQNFKRKSKKKESVKNDVSENNKEEGN